MKLFAGIVLAAYCLAACETHRDNKNDTRKTQPSSAVNERSYIKLGGEEQYVEITGASSDNPVLLFIHGGPGWPQTPHLRYFNADLTKDVILVAWEQSGCGKSLMRNPNPKNLSLEQIVNDAHELTQILKKKFNQDKIYLAGFSWGSVVGLKLIEKYPDDYKAYFGIAQVINIRESMKQSRKWIADQARANGDSQTLKTLAQIENGDTTVCRSDNECFIRQYELLSKYNGAVYNKESEPEIEKALAKYEDYRNYDWMGGFNYSIGRLEKDVFATDFSRLTETTVPVYFLIGRHDWSLPASITEEFVTRLKAPKKEIVWFENSGHGPLEEEPGKFNEAIRERVKADSHRRQVDIKAAPES